MPYILVIAPERNSRTNKTLSIVLVEGYGENDMPRRIVPGEKGVIAVVRTECYVPTIGNMARFRGLYHRMLKQVEALNAVEKMERST